MAKIFRATILATILALLCVTPVIAIDTPDTFSIISVSAWRHYLEDNDLLVMVRYDVSYDVIPDETVSQSIIARFGVKSGDDLASNVPYGYIWDSPSNKGYGEGIVTIYLSAQQVEDIAISWGGASYWVKLSGNPILSWDPTYPSDSFPGIIWKSYSNHTATANELRKEIIAIADELEDAWDDTTLITTTAQGNVLGTNGEVYFTRVFPDLRLAIPALFTVSLTTPSFREESHSQTYEQELKGDVPSWIQEPLDAGSDFFGITGGFIDLLIALAILIGCGVLAWKLKVGTEWGLIAAILIMVGVTRMGLISLTIMGVGALLCIILISFLLLLKKA